MQTEGLEQLLKALKRIALNTSGDLPAQVIAGEAISEFEKKQAVQYSTNANAVNEGSCNFPLCQNKQYQQDLAEQLHRELYADPQFEPVAWQFYQNGKWWNGDQHNGNHRKNTEAAGIPTRDLYARVSTNSACHECNSTGMRDSGGVHPWGEAIMVPCDCQHAASMALEFLEINGAHVAYCEVLDFDERDAYKNCTCGLEAILKALRSAVRTGNTTPT